MVKSKMEDKTAKPDWWPDDLPWSDTQTHVKYQQVSKIQNLGIAGSNDSCLLHIF